MKKALLLVLCFFCSQAFAFQKLSNNYLVSYGDPHSPVRITQYFSFTCPHCVALYRNHFQQIKKHYINSQKISWVFHPVPMDLLTVQAMECLAHLSDKEKKAFLEAILEELFIDRPGLSASLMQKGMEVLGKPLPKLREKSYLSETKTFQDAFEFLQQDETIEAVPAVEVNDTFLPGLIPDITFLETLLQQIGEKT